MDLKIAAEEKMAKFDRYPLFLRNLIREHNIFPRAGETVESYIARARLREYLGFEF